MIAVKPNKKSTKIDNHGHIHNKNASRKPQIFFHAKMKNITSFNFNLLFKNCFVLVIKGKKMKKTITVSYFSIKEYLYFSEKLRFPWYF